MGSYYGALLARAGHDVTMVARGAHRDEMRRCGAVRVREADGRVWSVPVRVVDAPHTAPDLALVTTKSQHTADAGRVLAPACAAGTAVLSLQNGVENPATLRAGLPGADVLGGIAFVGLRIDEPGVVDHQAEGWVKLGDPRGGVTPVARRVFDLVDGAWDATLSEDIVHDQWFKLLWNIGFNAICAVTGATAGEALANPLSRDLVREAVDEVVALARRSGVTLTADQVDQMAGYNRRLRDYRPSTAQDIAAGKPVEREALAAFVVRHGTQLGVPTPVNRVLDGLLSLQEDRATGRIAGLLEELDAGAG